MPAKVADPVGAGLARDSRPQGGLPQLIQIRRILPAKIARKAGSHS